MYMKKNKAIRFIQFENWQLASSSFDTHNVLSVDKRIKITIQKPIFQVDEKWLFTIYLLI